MMASVEEQTSYRVLLVEDDEEDVVLLRYMLDEVDTVYELDWVSSCDQGKEKLRDADYDICLTDFRLGSGNGLELVRHISDGRLCSAVVVMTGTQEEQLEIQSIRAGAQDYFHKSSIDGPRLDRIIRRSIERRRAEQRLAASEERFRVMSELSSAALHNIGNIMSSITTAASVLRKAVDDDKRFEKLTRVAEMIREHAGEPDYFLSEKGRAIPPYLETLGETVAEKRAGKLEELRRLEQAVELAVTVIRGQQTVFKTSGPIEQFDLMDAARTALDIRASSLENDAVQVTCHDGSVRICADRVLVTHTLINLIKNAIEAMCEVGDRCLTLTTRANPRGEAEISVCDNGHGISEPVMAKLFTHGFTTKEAGHGVGLHFCRRAAEMLGGRLEVESGGRGQGACFRLILPSENRVSD